MKIIVGPRLAGKTYETVQWVLEGEKTDSYPYWSRVILTHTLEASIRLRSEYPALDYRQVFSWQEWQKARRGPRQVEVAVDNLDLILPQLLGYTPDLITLNGGVEQ